MTSRNRKISDLSVIVGHYEKDGEEKAIWRTIGAFFEKENGGKFLTIDRAFSPAGLPLKGHSDKSIFITLTSEELK